MKYSKDFLFLLLAIVCGGFAGGVVALVMYPSSISTSSVAIQQSTSTVPLPTTSTAPVLSLVPAERPESVPLVPPAFLKRGSSAVATLYRKTKGVAFDDRLLGPDRELGRAVALTSDGWFVTSASVFDGLHLADVTLVDDGQSYVVLSGVIDHLNNTAFLKTSATGLPAPAFVQAGEISLGSQVWIESHPNGFISELVVDNRARVVPSDYASSETAARRFVLSGMTGSEDRGAAAWDPNGSFVGLVESKAGEEIRIVPATTIASSFASLLSQNQIVHAQLGVKALDLGAAFVDGSRDGNPETGALLRVAKTDSPATKAKLKTGDVILRVEHDILDGTADLGETLAEYHAGSVLTFRVLRTTTDGVTTKTADTDVQVSLGSVVTSEPLK